MSKANNSVYGTSYIPPNQLGDAYALAEQVVFQGISTGLSTFSITQNGDYLQLFALSPTNPPLFTTETYLPSYPSIAQVIGRTQHMGVNDSNSVMLSDLDMTNNNILNVNEIDVQDVNLGGHHLTTDSNGDILVDGQSADRRWYLNPVPSGSNITFLSANPLSPVNTLYTPNGTDLWYNNVNLTAGGGGGGGGDDWATYPANSNVQIPAPYGLNVGSNAPIATFPTITLCGNTTIGRASAIPLNAPNVEIYPYNFNVGSDLYPALSIELQSGAGGTTLESLEGISLDALIDVNINAGAVVALDAGADINLLAVGEISMESANMNVIVGGVETTAGTIVDTATTSIIETAPLIEMNGADFNVLSGATSIESATTAITSGAISIVGSATANVASPLTTITGAVLGIQSLATTITGNTLLVNPTDITLSPTANFICGLAGNNGSITSLNGKFITINSPNTITFNTGTGGVALGNNASLQVGNITDWNGFLNIRNKNNTMDGVSLCNVSYINSLNGTSINNVKVINCLVPPGIMMSNINKIDFVAKPNIGEINAVSSINGGGVYGDLNLTATDLIFNANSDTTFACSQYAVNATTELDLRGGNNAYLQAVNIRTNSASLSNFATNIYNTAPNSIYNTALSFNVQANSINFNTPPGSNPTQMNIPVINTSNINARNMLVSTINCSSITTSSIQINMSRTNEAQLLAPSSNAWVGFRRADYIDNSISWDRIGLTTFWDSTAENPIGTGAGGSGGGPYSVQDWNPIVSLQAVVLPTQGTAIVSAYLEPYSNGGNWWLRRYIQINTDSRDPDVGTITASILMIPLSICS
jgi:hypothetical protein